MSFILSIIIDSMFCLCVILFHLSKPLKRQSSMDSFLFTNISCSAFTSTVILRLSGFFFLPPTKLKCWTWHLLTLNVHCFTWSRRDVAASFKISTLFILFKIDFLMDTKRCSLHYFHSINFNYVDHAQAHCSEKLNRSWIFLFHGMLSEWLFADSFGLNKLPR